MGYINLYGISIYGGFHSHGDSPFMDGFFENPIEMDDLGGTPISGNLSIYIYQWHIFMGYDYKIL